MKYALAFHIMKCHYKYLTLFLCRRTVNDYYYFLYPMELSSQLISFLKYQVEIFSLLKRKSSKAAVDRLLKFRNTIRNIMTIQYW